MIRATAPRILTLSLLLLALGGAIRSSPAAVAQPQVPATYYGTASIDGKPVADGTEVTALIDGKDCTQPGGKDTLIQGSASIYVVSVMHESQAPGCGVEGKTVTFRVGARDAGQAAVWHAGLQHVDLNAGGGTPLALPPEANPTVSEANRLATATEQAKFTPRTGSPPTDAISLTRTPGAKPSVTDPPGKSGDGGISPLLVILAGAAVLVVLGAAGGVALSKRTQKPPNP